MDNSKLILLSFGPDQTAPHWEQPRDFGNFEKNARLLDRNKLIITWFWDHLKSWRDYEIGWRVFKNPPVFQSTLGHLQRTLPPSGCTAEKTCRNKTLSQKTLASVIAFVLSVSDSTSTADPSGSVTRYKCIFSACPLFVSCLHHSSVSDLIVRKLKKL